MNRAAAGQLACPSIAASQQQLAGSGSFLARMKARAVFGGSTELLKYKGQAERLNIGIGEHDRMAAHRLGGLDQRAVRLVPAAGKPEPMLNEHANQLGRQLAENAPRLVRAPLIGFALRFPPFDQQFKRPSQAQQHEGLGQRQQRSGDVGQSQRPGAQEHLLMTGGPAMLRGPSGSGAHAARPRPLLAQRQPTDAWAALPRLPRPQY